MFRGIPFRSFVLLLDSPGSTFRLAPIRRWVRRKSAHRLIDGVRHVRSDVALTSWPELQRTDMDRRRELARLYDDHVDAVYSYARNRVGADTAEDVTSEVFMAAARMYRAGRDAEVTIAWLIGVTRNRVIDRWRMSARHATKAHLLPPLTSSLPPDWIEDVRSDRVLEVMEGLNPRHRQLLTLHYVHGLPVKQIARRLGETDSAIESALKRGRDAFRKGYGVEDDG